MHHCLTIKQTTLLATLVVSEQDSCPDAELAHHLRRAELYDATLIIQTYFLCISLLHLKKVGPLDVVDCLRAIGELPSRMLLVEDLVSLPFVEFMLMHTHNSDLSLEENILSLYDDMYSYEYSKTVRS